MLIVGKIRFVSAVKIFLGESRDALYVIQIAEGDKIAGDWRGHAKFFRDRHVCSTVKGESLVCSIRNRLSVVLVSLVSTG